MVTWRLRGCEEVREGMSYTAHFLVHPASRTVSVEEGGGEREMDTPWSNQTASDPTCTLLNVSLLTSMLFVSTVTVLVDARGQAEVKC